MFRIIFLSQAVSQQQFVGLTLENAAHVKHFVQRNFVHSKEKTKLSLLLSLWFLRSTEIFKVIFNSSASILSMHLCSSILLLLNVRTVAATHFILAGSYTSISIKSFLSE